MLQQLFRIAIHERIDIPKPVSLHQRAVVVGQLEIRVILQEQVADIPEVHQPVQRLRLKPVFPAQLVRQ